MQRKGLGLLLAAAAAYGYYKYSKMTEEQKRDLANTIKEKGRKIFGSLVPQSQSEATGQGYGQSSNYSG